MELWGNGGVRVWGLGVGLGVSVGLGVRGGVKWEWRVVWG